MTPERYFFIHAFPCAYLKLERREIEKEEYNELENKFLKGNSPNKQDLEKIFSPAFVWIKKLATRMQKSYWDLDVIKEYWQKEHNRIIDAEEGVYKKYPLVMKDLCKIQEAEIIEKKKKVYVVGYGDEKRVVFNSIVPDADMGDKVKIHYAYAIEKVN